MELIWVLLIFILAAVLSLFPMGRRFAPVVTILASAAVFFLSLLVGLKTARGVEVVGVKDYISCDSFSALVLLLVAYVGFAAAVFSWGYLSTTVEESDDKKIRRYYSRFNLFLFSMLAVPIFSQITLVWIAVELTTLLSVFLVSFESTPEALEAAWKYAVLTCMGASLALLGIVLLRWGMGATETPFTWAGLASASLRTPPVLLYPAFFFILIGFGAKSGLVPMHTWLPDAHSQAPSPICAILSGIETTAVLYCIMRLLPLFPGGTNSYAGRWFVIFGLISAGTAAFLLIQVKDYKRLFAFSTVEHMGIILVAAGLGGYAAHLGTMMQIVSHTVTKSLCFFAAGATLLATGTRNIGAVRGLIRISPLAAGALAIGGLGIAGAPPFALFISEASILRAGILDGHYVVVGLLALFITTAFFGIMYQINRMLFGNAEITLMDERGLLFGRSTRPERNRPPATCVVALVITVIPVVLFGIYIPKPLEALLHNAAVLLGRL